MRSIFPRLDMGPNRLIESVFTSTAVSAKTEIAKSFILGLVWGTKSVGEWECGHREEYWTDKIKCMAGFHCPQLSPCECEFFPRCKNAFGIPKVTLLKTPKFQKAEETSSNGEVKLITADTGCIEMIIQSGTIRSLQRKLQCHVCKLKC